MSNDNTASPMERARLLIRRLEVAGWREQVGGKWKDPISRRTHEFSEAVSILDDREDDRDG